MLLYQIIEANDEFTQECDKTILIEKILPYRRSLKTYYRDQFRCDPVLMVTDVYNAAQYGLIIAANDLYEAIEAYIESAGIEEEEKEHVRELISFQSQIL